MNLVSDEVAAVPPVSDWWITSFCQLKCKMCIGPLAGNQDRNHHREGVLAALINSVTPSVSLCGGEPLVVPDIDRYAEALARSGKRIVLNTNGLLLRRRLRQGLRWSFSTVGISIHGASQAVHETMQSRGADLAEVIEAARYVGRRSDTSLKLATVVSAVNRHELPALAALVRDIRPDVWRLFQYSSRGPQNTGQPDHRVSPGDFARLVSEVTELAAPVPVAPATEEVGAGCLIIDPDGNVLEPRGLGYVRHGNCLDEPLDAIWARMPNHAVINSNKRWHALLPT